MDMQTTRDKVKAAYSSKNWSRKVDRMNNNQVIAVYMRLRANGKI